MKVGDLIELSAYGSDLKIFKSLRGKVGLVEKAEPDHYSIRWHGETGRLAKHRRMDLKRVK